MQPEEAHYFAMNNWQRLNATGFQRKIMHSLFAGDQFNKPVTVAGLTFPNQLGLGAGFDKDARWVDSLASMGFGHVEVGTLTPKPQPGNDKPRLFRLVEDKALINRMGFNNQGVDVAVARLKRRTSKVIVGGNIGKNKITPNEQAWDDYNYCFKQMFDAVDYFTVNVSSPNTPGLRELQDKEPLTQLLNGLVAIRKEKLQTGIKPIFLKIAPDLSNDQLLDIISLVGDTGIDGIVTNNTTISREGLKTANSRLETIGAGGLSGAPVKARSLEVLSFLHKESQGKIPLIGVGGIMNADDAKRRLDAGASLVQIYTGFIYGGVGIVKEIKKGLFA